MVYWHEKLFKIHDYSENMKSKYVTYSLKGKKYIWFYDLKDFKGITEESLTWSESEGLFGDKCLSEIYYDNKEKEFYELKWDF